MLSEKFQTIGGERMHGGIAGGEGNLFGEFTGPGIARQYGGALPIALTHDI
jgi:hypothetical protein